MWDGWVALEPGAMRWLASISCCGVKVKGPRVEMMLLEGLNCKRVRTYHTITTYSINFANYFMY
jgi:hypothetical protein